MHGPKNAFTPENTITFELPHDPGLVMTGALRGSLDRPVAMIVHGIEGSAYGGLQLDCARHLDRVGVSSIRLNLYGGGPGTRDRLVNNSLATDVQDIAAATEQLRDQGVKKLSFVATSFGALAVLKQTNLAEVASAVVLWEPSHGALWAGRDDRSNTAVDLVGDYAIFRKGVGAAHTQASRAEQDALGNTTDLAANIGAPLLIVTGDQTPLTPHAQAYHDAAQDPKLLVSIPGADHGFTGENIDRIRHELYQHTAEWILLYGT